MTTSESPLDLETDAGSSAERPERGFVLRLPARTDSVAVARSTIRRAIRFGSDDLESRYLTAFTEILINAIEEHQRLASPHRIAVVASLSDPVVITVTNTTSDDRAEQRMDSIRHTDDMTNQRGRGLLMATTLVPDVEIAVESSQVIVALPLGGFGAPA